MEIVYNSCCGIDVHKNKIVACLKVKGKKNVIKEFSGQTEDIRTMANWLKENKCEKIAMESTASYWKPLVNIFEIKKLDYTVINARDYKNLPGKKTDVMDSEWIADLLQHGLLKYSYIPSREQRELREATRYRKSLIQERSRALNRLQNKDYKDLGADYYNKFNTEKKANSYIKKLKELGYEVQINAQAS